MVQQSRREPGRRTQVTSHGLWSFGPARAARSSRERFRFSSGLRIRAARRSDGQICRADEKRATPEPFKRTRNARRGSRRGSGDLGALASASPSKSARFGGARSSTRGVAFPRTGSVSSRKRTWASGCKTLASRLCKPNRPGASATATASSQTLAEHLFRTPATARHRCARVPGTRT